MSAQISTLPPGLSDKALELAREVLRIEAAAVQALVTRLDHNFLAAVQIILDCKGRIVVSGMGKSGHIAPKSPWLASAGCTKKAGVPVLAMVEAILRAMWPDFPIPLTTMRPLQSRMICTAARKR